MATVRHGFVTEHAISSHFMFSNAEYAGKRLPCSEVFSTRRNSWWHGKALAGG
jgi:hypothetical protein